jgi:hypothetical protein
LPELPEVETVRRGLERQTVGLEIARVEVLRARAIAAPPEPTAFWQRVSLAVPLLASIALTVFGINPCRLAFQLIWFALDREGDRKVSMWVSEAAVERSFSHQSLLHTDLRNKLHEDTIHDVQVVPSIL